MPQEGPPLGFGQPNLGIDIVPQGMEFGFEVTIWISRLDESNGLRRPVILGHDLAKDATVRTQPLVDVFEDKEFVTSLAIGGREANVTNLVVHHYGDPTVDIDQIVVVRGARDKVGTG